jgi:tRNA(fMet)-specific endonuclease VapC
MLYMLDTNICIGIMKGHPRLQARLRELSTERMILSGIVLAELYFGVCKSLHRSQNERALLDFCAMCKVWDWPKEASQKYGEIRASLQAQGQVIGANDLLIAAHALSADAILVTNNLREFNRIPELILENWLAE